MIGMGEGILGAAAGEDGGIGKARESFNQLPMDDDNPVAIMRRRLNGN
jgi:hypothetical protein